MIEPTDEMIRAFMHAYALADDGSSEVILNHTAERAALAAVFAIVERDRCLKPRDHVFHPLDRYRAPSKWPSGRGALHPHFCVVCSDGEKAGPGCGNCRQTGMDQSPWPHCEQCRVTAP